jgi:hypothetical protein
MYCNFNAIFYCIIAGKKARTHYPQFRYFGAVPNSENPRAKKRLVDEFTFCVHLVNWEKENVTRKALKRLVLPALSI